MRLFVALILLALPLRTLRADVDSGPMPGEKVPPLKVLSVVGQDENKEIDASGQRGDKPTVYLFVRTDRWTRPVARTMKVLDQQLDKLGGEEKMIAVWLTDDQEKTKEYLPKAQQSLDFNVTTLALHPNLATGPEGWGINSDADLTVVVAGEKKVAARFGFVSPNEKVVRQVLSAIKKVHKNQ
jgi:hypothetical protein